MKFKAPAFLTPYIAKTVVLAGRFLPINIVTGVGLLMATAMGDVANVRRLCKKVRSDKLPLALQHHILNESVGNILLLNKWQPTKGVNRPQEREALDTFDCVSSVVWDITPKDTRNILEQLVDEDHLIPESVDIGQIAVKLCTRQIWSAEHKCIVFSVLCQQTARALTSKYGPSQECFPAWSLAEIYDKWKFDLKADVLVPSFPSQNPFTSISSKRQPFTLLENCVGGAPEHVVIDMVHNCISQNTLTQCSAVFKRPDLNESILYAFIKKGMNVEQALGKMFWHIKPHATIVDLENELGDYSSTALQTLKNVQLQVAAENQKAVLVQAVEETERMENMVGVVHRRKM